MPVGPVSQLNGPALHDELLARLLSSNGLHVFRGSERMRGGTVATFDKTHLLAVPAITSRWGSPKPGHSGHLNSPEPAQLSRAQHSLLSWSPTLSKASASTSPTLGL